MIGGVAPVFIPQLTFNDNIINQNGNVVTGSINTNTTGLTSVSNTITTKTLVLFCFGQSILDNSIVGGLYTPTNTTTVQMLNPYNSTVYQALDPLLGCQGTNGNYITRVADQLVTAGKFARVIICNTTFGSTNISEWAQGIFNQRIRIPILMARSFGWFSNSNVSFGVIWDQGNQDATPLGTSAASWEASFGILKQSVVGLGLNCKWFVPIQTMTSNVVYPTIQGAQQAVVDNVTVFQGANTDSLTGANRDGTGTHLSPTGAANNAALWTPIIEANY